MLKLAQLSLQAGGVALLERGQRFGAEVPEELHGELAAALHLGSTATTEGEMGGRPEAAKATTGEAVSAASNESPSAAISEGHKGSGRHLGSDPQLAPGLGNGAVGEMVRWAEAVGGSWILCPLLPGLPYALLAWRTPSEQPWQEQHLSVLRGFAEEISRTLLHHSRPHLEHVSDQVWLLDRDYRVLYLNPAALADSRRCGFEPGVGDLLWDLLPELEHSSIHEQYERCLSSGRPGELQEYYAPLEVWVEQTLHPAPEGLWIYSRNVTSERRQEHHLREREALTRAILDASSTAIFVKDEEGRYLEANATTLEVFGLPREQVLGRRVSELLPPPVAAALEANDAEVLRSGRAVHKEEVIEPPGGGSSRTFLSAKFPVAYEGRTVLCGIATDVTERTRSDRQIQKERERFEFVLEGIGMGVWYCDLPFDVLQWDQRTKEHFGLPPEAVVTIEDFYAIIVPEDREATRRAIQESIDSRMPYDTVYRTFGPDAKMRWIRALGRTSYGADGAPIRFDGITLDVSRQYRYKQQMLRSEERYRSLVEATSAIVWTCDPEGNFIQPQKTWEEYTGQSYAEHAGLGWRSALHPDDLEQLWEAFLAAASSRQAYQASGRLWHAASQAYRHTDLRAVPLLDAADAINEWVATIYDVQERREAELTALRANRMKSEFLANMSHELRTPMTGVQGMLDLLFDTPLEPLQRSYLETIRDCSRSLLSVLDDVLDLSRIEAGKLVLKERPYELRPAIASTLALFALQAEERGLTLCVDIAPEIPAALLGDPERIRQILVNLVSNAMKFTPEGTVTLTVAAESGLLTFSVRGSGIGISAEDQAKLFQPFVQLDSSTARRYHGTGLGLSIVRRLVELMEGEMGLESEPGRGSTFWFRLPLRAVEASQIEEEQDSELDLSTPEARVLLVEDNPINRRVVTAQLEKLGHTVEWRERGTHALELLSEGASFDVILMDCQMPELDGYETTRRLRAGGVRTPVVALTAHAMEGERERCLAAGMDDYLTKPLSHTNLRRTLRRWLGPALTTT